MSLARSCLLVLAILSLAPPLAAAQGVAADARPIVLVVDPGRARVSSDRLLRVIAAATSRELVRITDDRARDPAGTLTIAYEARGTWLVRFDRQGRSAIAHERVTRPGALDASLAAAARRVIGEVAVAERGGAPGRAPAEAARPSPAQARDDDESLYIAWADEILDPFAGLPPPERREVAIYSEVIDPFAPAAARQSAWSEVLDPWEARSPGSMRP